MEAKPNGPDVPAAGAASHEAVHAAQAPRGRELALASLGALGVVYGDIGTSPLYAIKECLAWHPEGKFSPHAVEPTLINVLGVLSLMFWALVLVICLKYLVFVLRADNRGEGGILALAALVGDTNGKARPGRLAVPILLGLFGTGLLFGDGAITPAISVLGAMEGLSEQSPALTHLVVPITVGILVGLFLVQRHGTGRIGTAFGPVMLVWFAAIGAIGAIGVHWIAAEPGVLAAINPVHGVRFLATHGAIGFLLVGLVFLVVTGGEALYADMGHFGRAPIRIAWFAVALPGLLLNYFGQGALLLASPPGTVKNPFYAAADIELLGVSMLIDGREVHLTPIEFRLLLELARNPGRVLTHRQLLSEVWGPNAVEHTHYLRVHMGALRRKIEADPARPQWLLTEAGVGYRLREPAP